MTERPIRPLDERLPAAGLFDRIEDLLDNATQRPGDVAYAEHGYTDDDAVCWRCDRAADEPGPSGLCRPCRLWLAEVSDHDPTEPTAPWPRGVHDAAIRAAGHQLAEHIRQVMARPAYLEALARARRSGHERLREAAVAAAARDMVWFGPGAGTARSVHPLLEYSSPLLADTTPARVNVPLTRPLWQPPPPASIDTPARPELHIEVDPHAPPGRVYVVNRPLPSADVARELFERARAVADPDPAQWWSTDLPEPAAVTIEGIRLAWEACTRQPDPEPDRYVTTILRYGVIAPGGRTVGRLVDVTNC